MKKKQIPNGYLVSRMEPLVEVLDQGKRSSEQFFGKPLYPMPTIFFSSLTIHAPTCVFGSLLLCELKIDTAKKYSSQSR